MEEKKNNLKPYKFVFKCFIIILLLFLYTRYVGTKVITTKEENIVNKDIPEAFYGYKIVQISDLHYNSTITKEDLKNIKEQVNKSKPDILVITGDLLSSNTKYTDNDFKDLNNFIKSLNAHYKYIITGCSDNNIDEIIKDTDFKLLDNDYEVLYNGSYEPIIIGGLSSKKDNVRPQDKAEKILTAIDTYKSTYNILITHEPSIIDGIDTNSIDLVLAGHTHNGQINIPYLKYMFMDKEDIKYNGNHIVNNNVDIYISNGLGTTNFKGRLFAHPKINLYRLMDK